MSSIEGGRRLYHHSTRSIPNERERGQNNCSDLPIDLHPLLRGGRADASLIKHRPPFRVAFLSKQERQPRNEESCLKKDAILSPALPCDVAVLPIIALNGSL